ncbi:hypothetical protein HBI81_090250 [Parastagonospora nodorum]|nr:hypothetical protein HBI81_090250 [Parastagonospora nodorum]
MLSDGVDRSSCKKALDLYCYVIRVTAKSAENIFNYLGNENCYTANLDILLKSSTTKEDRKVAKTLLLLKKIYPNTLILLYKPVVQAVMRLGLRKKFCDENVLVMLGGIT